jgi:hypothetical protein
MSIRTGKNVRIIPCDQIHTRKPVDKAVENPPRISAGLCQVLFHFSN